MQQIDHYRQDLPSALSVVMANSCFAALIGSYPQELSTAEFGSAISDLTCLSFVASHPYFIILQRQVYFLSNETILLRVSI